MELPAIQAAIADNILVIACGGGGVPVVFKRERLVGVDAVIDKDRASSLLAWELEAELFLISTAVDQVALFRAPLLLGGRRSLAAFGGPDPLAIEDALHLRPVPEDPPFPWPDPRLFELWSAEAARRRA